MDKYFDVLIPAQNADNLIPTMDAVVHNFKELFMFAYPHCPNFNISHFKVRFVSIPKQNFK
jgi:hypothetical protein